MLPSLTGCMGIYVEGQASATPSLKFSPETGKPGAVAPETAISGGAFGMGLAAGIDFDFSRKHRFALGYQHISTKIGDGGTASGGASDARFDLLLAKLGESNALRLGAGFGFGSGESSGFKNKAGAPLATKTDANAGALYAGPVFSRYIAGHHELTGMIGGQYFFAAVPGGSVSGPGVVAKLTYTFHIMNDWPEITFVMPSGTDRNIMPFFEQGAQAAGCTARARVSRDNTFASMRVECPGKGPVDFIQTSELFGGFCNKMSSDDCDATVHKIIAKTREVIAGPKHEPVNVPPPAPAVSPAPPADAAQPVAPDTAPGDAAAPEAPATTPPTGGAP